MTSLPDALAPVVAALDREPLVRTQGVVFGSLTKAPATARDVDLALLVAEPFEGLESIAPYRRLLRSGREGTPGYGRLDVFLVFPNALLVRDPACRGFVRAQQVRALRQAIAAEGVPWDAWRDTVGLGPSEPPPPSDPRRRPGP